MLFHKVKDVAALPGMRLVVRFANGTTKEYDVSPLTRRFPAFEALRDANLFGGAEVDVGVYGNAVVFSYYVANSYTMAMF